MIQAIMEHLFEEYSEDSNDPYSINWAEQQKEDARNRELDQAALPQEKAGSGLPQVVEEGLAPTKQKEQTASTEIDPFSFFVENPPFQWNPKVKGFFGYCRPNRRKEVGRGPA
jgi:hypothetical protein